VWLHSFLTVALNGCEWLTSRLFRAAPQKNTSARLNVGWLGPRAGLDVLDAGGTELSKTLSFVAPTKHCSGRVVSLPREQCAYS
jgi:hypothetical protein